MTETVSASILLDHVCQPDPLDLCRRAIENGLHLLKMEAGVADRIGLSGLHPLPGHVFAWQFWLRGAPGVFQIEFAGMMGADPQRPNGYRQADLLVRYFPNPEEPLFSAFSAAERSLRSSEAFASDGAPVRSASPDILASTMFCVGLLRLVSDPDGQALSLQVCTENLLLDLDECGVSRAVPGLDVIWPLFDFLVTMSAFVHKSAPVGTFVHSGNPVPHPISEPLPESAGIDVGLQVILPVDLIRPGNGARPIAGLAAAQLIAAAEDASRETCRSGAGKSSGWVNADWWEAASWIFEPEGACCAGALEHVHDAAECGCHRERGHDHADCGCRHEAGHSHDDGEPMHGDRHGSACRDDGQKKEPVG